MQNCGMELAVLAQEGEIAIDKMGWADDELRSVSLPFSWPGGPSLEY